MTESLELLKSESVDYYLDFPNEYPYIWMQDEWYYENLILRQELGSERLTLVKEYGDVRLYKINYVQ